MSNVAWLKDLMRFVISSVDVNDIGIILFISEKTF